jgi:hypothetical protein
MKQLLFVVLIGLGLVASGNAMAKDFGARAYCPMTHVTGIGHGSTPETAKEAAIRACISKGGIPACCNKFVRMI